MRFSMTTILSTAIALTVCASWSFAQQAGNNQKTGDDQPASNQPVSMSEMQPMRPMDSPPAPTQPPPAANQRTVIDLDDAPDVGTQRSTPAESIDDDREPSGVRAEDVLREFQLERPKPVPVLPGKANDQVDSGGDPETALTVPDGYFIVDRSVRLVQEGEWWVIHFIADNNPTSSPQKPMRLLPNRMLERMIHESQVVSQYEYIVSGEVTRYMDENYLLLRKLMRRRNMGNLSR